MSGTSGMRRRSAIVVALGMALLGCSVGSRAPDVSPLVTAQPSASVVATVPSGTPSTSPDVSASAYPAPTPERPVDPDIEPVSRSDPSEEARQAMGICQIELYGLDAIAGMGRIDQARRAIEYVLLTGREPLLASDRPAWIIQFRTEITWNRPAGEYWIDPICAVVDGDWGFFASGPVIRPDGGLRTPIPVDDPPVWSLPPLAP